MPAPAGVGRVLTPLEFHGLAAVSREAQLFANTDNWRTHRAYQHDFTQGVCKCLGKVLMNLRRTELEPKRSPTSRPGPESVAKPGKQKSATLLPEHCACVENSIGLLPPGLTFRPNRLHLSRQLGPGGGTHHLLGLRSRFRCLLPGLTLRPDCLQLGRQLGPGGGTHHLLGLHSRFRCPLDLRPPGLGGRRDSSPGRSTHLLRTLGGSGSRGRTQDCSQFLFQLDDLFFDVSGSSKLSRRYL